MRCSTTQTTQDRPIRNWCLFLFFISQFNEYSSEEIQIKKTNWNAIPWAHTQHTHSPHLFRRHAFQLDGLGLVICKWKWFCILLLLRAFLVYFCFFRFRAVFISFSADLLEITEINRANKWWNAWPYFTSISTLMTFHIQFDSKPSNPINLRFL